MLLKDLLVFGLVVAAAAEPIRDLQTRGRNPMTPKNLMRLAAYGGITALVLAVMLILGSGSATSAQSEDAGSHKRLEGVWRFQVTVRNCQTGEPLRTFPALFTFAKGGTLTVTTAGQFPALSTPGLGVWRHTDGDTYSAVFEAFVFSPAGAWIQTHRITHSIEVGDDADEFADTVKLEIFGTTGNLIATGCGTSAARRFE